MVCRHDGQLQCHDSIVLLHEYILPTQRGSRDSTFSSRSTHKALHQQHPLPQHIWQSLGETSKSGGRGEKMLMPCRVLGNISSRDQKKKKNYFSIEPTQTLAAEDIDQINPPRCYQARGLTVYVGSLNGGSSPINAG